MPSSGLIIITIAVLLPALIIVRFVLLSRWLDRLNNGLPPEQHFHLIGSYTPSEHIRLWRRWREVRNRSNKIHPPWWILVVVLPWVLGLALQIREWATDRRVAVRQQTTTGLIIDHQPANHNMYGYKFEVNGKSYVGWQSPNANELAIGKQVVVYYDPQNPTRNALTDFHVLTTTSLGPVPLLLFGIGAVALFIQSRRRKNAAFLRAQCGSANE